MSGRVWSVGAACLLAACMLRPARTPPAAGEPDPSSSAGLLLQAQREATAGHQQAALDLYDRVLSEHPDAPEAAEALHDVGMLRADPASPVRDRRLARTTFTRLVSEYPSSRFAPDGRAWRSVLQELDRCQNDAAELRRSVETLKRLDLELERRP